MHLSVCTPRALPSPPQGPGEHRDLPVLFCPGEAPGSPPAGSRSSWSIPLPELSWAGLGSNRETRSLYAPSLVLEFRADRPSLGNGKGPEGTEAWGGRGAALPAWGLLTSVCLLLAFFLESFRPVLFRSL